jgi:hypothetical protein
MTSQVKGNNTMSDLNILQPEPVVVTVGDEHIEVLPLKFGQFGAFTRTIQPMIEDVNVIFAEDKADSVFAFDLASLLSKHSELLIKAVSIAIQKPLEWVELLDMAEAIKLIQAVLEVNMDFFAQSLVPTLNQAMQSLSKKLSDGSMSFSV